MVTKALKPFAHRPPRFLEIVACSLASPIFGASDNRIDTNAFLAGKGWMIGDIVEVRRPLRRRRLGEIVRLQNCARPGRNYLGTFFVKSALVEWDTGDTYAAPSQMILVERPRSYYKYFMAVYMNEEYIAFRDREMTKDPNVHLENCLVPDRFISDSVNAGIRALALAGDNAVADVLFERAAEQARFVDRTSKQPDSPKLRPLNRAMMVLIRALAAAMSDGTLDRRGFAGAVKDLEEHCAKIPKGYWDSMGRNHYLQAVMVAMLDDDMEKARQLLKSRRSFREFEDLLGVLKKFARKSAKPASDPELVGKATGCFDFMRHPFLSFHRDVFQGEMTVLLLGALLQKLIHAPGQEIDWRAVARAVYR